MATARLATCFIKNVVCAKFVPPKIRIFRIMNYDQAFMDTFMEKFALREKYLRDNTVYAMSQNNNIIGFLVLFSMKIIR
jgi:hypothetical protein